MVYAFVRIHADTSLTVGPQTSEGINLYIGVTGENRTHISGATIPRLNHWTTITITCRFLHLGPMSRFEFETWSYGFHVQLVPPQVFIVSSAPHYAVYSRLNGAKP